MSSDNNKDCIIGEIFKYSISIVIRDVHGSWVPNGTEELYQNIKNRIELNLFYNFSSLLKILLEPS